MAIGTFSPPEGWEDWTTLVLGVWLWASTVVLHVADLATVQNFLAVGLLVIIVELFTFYFLRSWEEWINIVLGIWLIISLWLLDIDPPAARVNAVIVGLLLIALSLYEIWDDQRHHSV